MSDQLGKFIIVPKLEIAEKTIKQLERDLGQAVRATVLQHQTICNLADEIERLKTDKEDLQRYLDGMTAKRDELRTKYDQLTGEKFSDRCHAALRDRARKAELERDEWKRKYEVAEEIKATAGAGETEKEENNASVGN